MVITEKWDAAIAAEFDKPYYKALMAEVEREYAQYDVYPPRESIFAAPQLVDYDKVKVVILGQDPYHGAGQANGLAFAVNNGIEPPPSLVNIFKEIVDDIGGTMPASGNLEYLARQGVLLLNATLTVDAHQPASHRGIGWEQFTDAAIEALQARSGIVYMQIGRAHV